MRLADVLRTGLSIGVILSAGLCHSAQEPAKDARPGAVQGLPPRAAPTDYQAQAQAGAVTIAADFVGHSVPTADGTLSTEEYVVVEAALFGAAGAKLQISPEDFSLRINGKKAPSPSKPYGLVASTLKDPLWAPPESQKQEKPKTSIGGGGQGDSGPPKEVKPPIELQRAWAQHTKMACLASGERNLPQAGLLFFPHRGKVQNITALELIYAGAAGKASLTLQP